MSGAATTGVRFRQRELPGGDAAEFVRSGLTSAPQRHHVSVRVRTSGDAVRRQVRRWGTVEDLGDQECRLQMEVDDLGWPLFVLAGLGVDFEVEAPAELTAHAARAGALFTRAAAAG